MLLAFRYTMCLQTDWYKLQSIKVTQSNSKPSLSLYNHCLRFLWFIKGLLFSNFQCCYRNDIWNWEFGNWKKSSTFSNTKFHAPYNLVGSGAKDIQFRTIREKGSLKILYILYSGKIVPIQTLFLVEIWCQVCREGRVLNCLQNKRMKKKRKSENFRIH